MPSYKLTYFDGRGRAEVARLLFAASGTEFEDVRITREQWGDLKEKTPLGQVPMLEVDGKAFGQSVAIFSFLARRFGYYGNSDLDALGVDQVVQLVSDMISIALKGFLEKDEAKKAQLKKEFDTEVVPKYLGIMEKLLKANGDKGYFVGSSLTLADFVVFDLITGLERQMAGVTASVPSVKAVVDNVQANEKIKTYLANRKETEF